MTRLISGFAGSTRLAVPKRGTRPTSDRVREAIFSALDARDELAGARVLDLYAGSGALGLEAASRGAREVVLVEKSEEAANVCRKNAEAVRSAARGRRAPTITVAGQSVQSYLATRRSSVDVVFIDPPYELGETEVAADLAALAPLLSEDATVIVERSGRSPEPIWPAGIRLERKRDYGDTMLWWAYAADPDAADDDEDGPADGESAADQPA
ncbi:16S rRNA (guanine(966)-N(2))-methyltransferase RsmD [Agromyces seonyuensis]|uniref:16S rRNA (Guanine(966)-N(2))-methyltransferase RsmD n=1 Tax=Agromyces seonyuensis TaxID=2662446 RepID=A0A6I4NZ22_9MICO|nr:16S rRNA (guanine(966)-N(2))-methyltransferase RsmD [Agromyces seonyuensis]MWB97685.1 16S rRNA (guanine(966)-N(2))-methyltransferase RsmD [Agromyces seonyuensis]